MYVPVILVRFLREFNFRDEVSENIQIRNFMKIRSVGGGVFHGDLRTDGRTDRQAVMTHLIVAVRNFANAPNKLIQNRLPKMGLLHSINLDMALQKFLVLSCCNSLSYTQLNLSLILDLCRISSVKEKPELSR
jgi:hypothetical protein